MKTERSKPDDEGAEVIDLQEYLKKKKYYQLRKALEKAGFLPPKEAPDDR